MHKDSHSIFEAYVLAKRVEQQQLNEGLFDGVSTFFKERGIKKQDDKRLETYRDLWKRYYFPRFRDKKEIENNKEKAIQVFTNFLNERDWGDREKNVAAAIEHFKSKYGEDSFQDLQDDSLRVLLYGRVAAQSILPSKKSEPASEVKPEKPDASGTETEKSSSVSSSSYASDPKTKEAIDASHARKSETIAPTPSPVASGTETTPADETSEDSYKLKAEITRLKNLNQAWVNAIKKKLGRTVRKPSDLAGKPASKKLPVRKK